MPASNPKPLPGHDCQIVDARSAVEALAPGAFDRLPFTSRVFAENLVRKSGKSDALEEGLKQVVLGRSDADFPFYPARVVLQDLLGTPALVDLAG